MGLKVYVGGTFDLFHAGHVRFLARASQFGEVWVALNTDEFITKFKGAPPVMTYKERAVVVGSCRWVTGVVPNKYGADSKATIEMVEPNLIVVGSDWATKDYYGQMGFDQNWLDGMNIGLLYLPYTKHISSTDIKARLTARR